MSPEQIASFIRERLPLPDKCTLNTDAGSQRRTRAGFAVRRNMSLDVTARIPADVPLLSKVGDSLEQKAVYSRLNEELVGELWNVIYKECLSSNGQRLPWDLEGRLVIGDDEDFTGIFFDSGFHFVIRAKFHHEFESRTYWKLDLHGVILGLDRRDSIDGSGRVC